MTDSPASGFLFTMYSTQWCGHCMQVRQWLKSHGLEPGRDYTEIDIEAHPDACATVEQCNGGNRSVPTLVFPDNSTLTEPSNPELEAKIGPLLPHP